MTDKNDAEAIGFGYAEIAYLLKRMSTPAALMTATVLRLTEEMDSEVLVFAGASSLLGREFATVSDDDIEIVDAAVPVSYAMGRATLWTEISLMESDISDTIVHVESNVDDPKQRHPDLTRANTILNWHPSTGLDDGLRKTIEYFKGVIAEGGSA